MDLLPPTRLTGRPLDGGSQMPLPAPRALALPAQRGLALTRPGWPADGPAAAAKAARGFEAMLVAQMLGSSRAFKMSGGFGGDSPLGGGRQVQEEQIDRLRAEMIASTAPFGIARLLPAQPAAEAAR